MPALLTLPAKKVQPFPDFGKWLTFAEAIHSDTAISHGIKNIPNKYQYERMCYTYEHGYAPLCEWVGEKIPLNSFFRCEQLNNLIPGASATSEHVQGGAFDSDCRRFSNPLTNNQLFEHIRLTMDFDQLIFESPDQHNVPGWVHYADRPDGNRHSILKMVRTKTGPVYLHWPFKV